MISYMCQARSNFKFLLRIMIKGTIYGIEWNMYLWTRNRHGVHRFPSYEIITEGIKGKLLKAYVSQRLNKALISGPVTEVSNYNMERLTYLSG